MCNISLQKLDWVAFSCQTSQAEHKLFNIHSLSFCELIPVLTKYIFWQMNIRIYFLPQNQMNISTSECICLEIFKCLYIAEYLQYNNSKNNESLYGYICCPKILQIFVRMSIFFKKFSNIRIYSIICHALDLRY